MAVDKVTGNWEGLGVDAGADGVEAPQYFDVTFDNNDPPEQRPLLAWSATDGTTSIPALYSPHPYNSLLFVRRKNVDTIGPFHFRVNVYYSTRPVSPAGDSQFDPFSDPLEKPWEVEWGFVTSNEPIDRDIHGDPIVNSAEESSDPPKMIECNDLLLTIRRNEGDFNFLRAADYKDAVNADTFYGFAPGIVRCINYSGRRAFTGVMFYWQVTYSFRMRPRNWKLKIIDEGFREWTGWDSDGYPIYEQIRDKNDMPVSQPVALCTGIKKPQAIPLVVLEFEIYPQLPFSVLGLQ